MPSDAPIKADPPMVDFDGCRVAAWTLCPNGQIAYLDRTASYPAYRCSYCQAVLGSVGCGCTMEAARDA